MINGWKRRWSPTIENGVDVMSSIVATVIANSGRSCGERKKEEIRKKKRKKMK